MDDLDEYFEEEEDIDYDIARARREKEKRKQKQRRRKAAKPIALPEGLKRFLWILLGLMILLSMITGNGR